MFSGPLLYFSLKKSDQGFILSNTNIDFESLDLVCCILLFFPFFCISILFDSSVFFFGRFNFWVFYLGFVTV